MKKTPALLSITVVIALGLGLTGCSKFTMLGARVAKVNSGAPIAVSVVSSASRENDQASLSSLEGYLTAALLAKKHTVKTLRLEALIGQRMLRQLMPPSGTLLARGRSAASLVEGAAVQNTYSVGMGLAAGIAEGGSIEGDAEMTARLLDQTEIKDAQARLNAIVDLAAEFSKSWGVDYILFVDQFDAFGFGCYVVHLPSRQVINAMVISGNAKGFAGALGAPTTGRQAGAKDGDLTRLQYMRLAEFLTREL